MYPGGILVIGEPDAVLGLGLIGLEGQAVTNLREAEAALEQALRRADVALILLTEDWAEALQEVTDQASITEATPMVIEIPSSRVVERSSSLHQRVERTLGIRLEG